MFQEILSVANEQAHILIGRPNVCILSSFALAHTLQQLGYDARPIRVEVHLPGRVLGGEGLGKWAGHVVVAVQDQYLLDPTLDQIPGFSPELVRVHSGFWKGKPVHHYCINDMGDSVIIQYLLHPIQDSLPLLPDAQPSCWRPLADRILAEVSQRHA